MPKIESSDSVLILNNFGADSDSTNINVTPDSMSTHALKIDTGDGVDWFSVSPTGETGDYVLTVYLLEYPIDSKSASVKISDNHKNADDLYIDVQYFSFE